MNNLTLVKSTNIDAIGYENENLFVKFKNGRIYKYLGVGELTFRDFLSCESKGKYFHQNINKKYEYKQVNET